MPASDTDHGHFQWEHAHQCPQCGQVVKGDDIPYEAVVAGIINCPNCGWSGPINIQIVRERGDAA